MTSVAVVLALTLQSSVTAIVGARIEIGDGRVIERGTVLMREGLIEEVGAEVSVPAGADIVEGNGLVVYPGFIDAYTTRGVKLPSPPAAKTPPDSRTTAPAFMWPENRRGIRPEVDVATALDLDPADWYAQGVLSALVAPGGGSIRGRAAVVVYTDEKDRQVLRNKVAMEMGFRSVAGGRGGGGAPPAVPGGQPGGRPGGQPGGQPGGETQGQGQGYPGSLLGVIALTRQTLYDAQDYDANGDKDEALAALAPLLRGEFPALWAADTEREIGRAIHLSEEFGLKLMLSGARDAYRTAELLKERKVPVFLNIAAGAEPRRANEPDASDPLPQAALEERYQNWRERATNPIALHEKGVDFAFGSEGDPIGDFLPNVRRLVSWGLPREVALRTLTLRAAELLGVGDQLGTLEKGKLANVVVMDGDFVEEKSKVKMVFVLGKKAEVK